MFIIQRKSGRIWKTVLQVSEGGWDQQWSTIKFMIQCGVDLRISWQDPKEISK